MLMVVREELADAVASDGGSRAAQVISNVKRMIATGELQAGDRLPIEKVLAAKWGVSRGSLREGVRALAALGVLETRQGDGTYVTQLDPMTLLSPLGFYSEPPTCSPSGGCSRRSRRGWPRSG
jgi:GntR family transcriptional repressor for pyruvate dehydrogenase complex